MLPATLKLAHRRSNPAASVWFAARLLFAVYDVPAQQRCANNYARRWYERCNVQRRQPRCSVRHNCCWRATVPVVRRRFTQLLPLLLVEKWVRANRTSMGRERDVRPTRLFAVAACARVEQMSDYVIALRQFDGMPCRMRLPAMCGYG